MADRDTRASIRSSLNKRDMKGERKGSRASRAYNRFFEGYTETSVETARGTKIERTYTGSWYEQPLSRRGQVVQRVAELLLWLGALALLAFASLKHLPMNRQIYVEIMQAATLFLTGWLASPLISYLTLYGRLTEGAYRRSAKKLPAMALRAAMSMVALAVLGIVAIIVTGEGLGSAELAVIGCDVAAAACLYLIRLLEKRIPWTRMAQSQTPMKSEDALDIVADPEDE